MDPNPPLLTSRLRLEPQTRAHAPEMMHVLADPRIHTHIPTDPPTDEHALAERYARLETRRSPDGLEHWLNWIVYHQNTAIGTVQASAVIAEATSDVAYVFHPDFWGQGFASEAMQAMLEHLKTNLGVRTFTANVDTRNQASQRLLERLGFQKTRLIEHADEFKGSVSDEFVYEYPASRP